jgi:hypothetical protein
VSVQHWGHGIALQRWEVAQAAVVYDEGARIGCQSANRRQIGAGPKPKRKHCKPPKPCNCPSPTPEPDIGPILPGPDTPTGIKIYSQVRT